VACAPSAEGPGPRSDGQSTSIRKTLRLGSAREPIAGIAVFAGGGEALQRHTWIFHAGLTAYDADYNLQPRLASKVPSLADGDWIVLPNGGMELTWKLRPNLKWHDGTPLSAEDFVLGIEIAKDPALPVVASGGISLVKEAVATDAVTLLVRWSAPYFGANVGTPAEFPAVPRHIVGDLYRQGDKDALVNNPYWATEFVGLGPYKLSEWALGSYTEGLAFDDYVLGRPKIDRVIIRYFGGDVTTMLAALLSSEIDLVMGAFKDEDVATLKSAWEPSGGGTIVEALNEIIMVTLQYRDTTLPWARDVRVRQALMHLTDRQALADTFSPAGGPADLYLTRNDPIFRTVEQRGFARYPYDPARAERLLADAGWARGPEGVFQTGTGDRFRLQVRVVSASQSNVQQTTALADLWKRSGLESDVFVIPFNTQNSEAKAMSPAYWQSDAIQPQFFESFTTAQMQTPENSWRGRNMTGYSNTEFNRLFEQYSSALETTQRQSLYAEVVKRVADEALLLPLYYTTGTSYTSFRRGIRGPGAVMPIQKAQSWNIHEWEID
jgi:peptide/nickel transport system substrate-binding protein